jgi:hypothetical protein
MRQGPPGSVSGVKKLRDRLAKWLTSPWTASERLRHEIDWRKVEDEYTVRGALNSGGHKLALAELWADERARFIRTRTMGLVIAVVAVCSFLTAFTGNRAVHGIEIAAIASAAPAALYLGLRRS